MNDITPGLYRHYKGNDYTVLGVALHSETQEEFVIYRPEYGDKKLWVRPKAMFTEMVHVDGQEVPRFQSQETESMPQRNNLFHDLPKQLPEEFVEILFTARQVRTERIISQGHASPAGFWYDQPEQEWVILLRGSARLRFEDRLLEMKPGDYVHIPAHQKHRVDWTTLTEPTIWLAMHCT